MRVYGINSCSTAAVVPHISVPLKLLIIDLVSECNNLAKFYCNRITISGIKLSQSLVGIYRDVHSNIPIFINFTSKNLKISIIVEVGKNLEVNLRYTV